MIKSNSKRSKRLISILNLYFLTNFIGLIIELYKYKVYSNHQFNPILDAWETEYDFPDVIRFDMYAGLFAFLFIPIAIITIIRFIKWFRRSYCNLNRVGIDTDKKEGWAAGSWFIPIYNLGAPESIMKEIWEKTQKFYTNNIEDNEIITKWWILWITTLILNSQSDKIASFLMEDNTLQAQIIISIISYILYIPLTYITIKLVKKVSNFEDEMYKKATSDLNE